MTQFVKWFKELNLFFEKITQRIGLDSKTWTLCFSNLIPRTGLILMTPRLEASFLNYDTKNFFLKKKKKMTQRIGPKFLTQRNVFFVWLKEMIFCMAQRIDFFVWLKELKPFSLNMTQRIETFFFEYDAENWCLFLFLPQRIETFSSLPQMIELFFFKNFIDSKNWTFFSDMTQRNEIRKKKRLKELNLFFWNMTYRIEPLLFSLIWFKELNFVSKKKTQKIEIFFFNNDSKDWTLCKRLIELSLFYEPLLNLILFFFLLTQRIEPS